MRKCCIIFLTISNRKWDHMAKQLSRNVNSQGVSSSEPFVIKRAKRLLESQLEEKGVVRITYIALKKELIAEFGETEFGRNKTAIQKLLENAVCAKNPRVAKTFANDSLNKSESVNTKQHEHSEKSKERKSAKSSRLYFYKMHGEDVGSSEGNRYISNNDL